MQKNEKFPWDVEIGAAVDYANGRLMFVVKDDSWNEEQLKTVKDGYAGYAGFTNGLVIFLLEGGPLDTCDFYFNVQECEEKEALLNAENLEIAAVLLDENNVIADIRTSTQSKEVTKQIQDLLKKQDAIEFMPGEYDCNVEGMQSAFDPADLVKYTPVTFKVR
jgi:hypothetical protein